MSKVDIYTAAIMHPSKYDINKKEPGIEGVRPLALKHWIWYQYRTVAVPITYQCYDQDMLTRRVEVIWYPT